MASVIDQGLGILEQIAPTLATMIGGPFAGTAVAAIEKGLGLNATGDQAAALTAVAGATPEQLLALKAEDNRHQEAMAKLGVDLQQSAEQGRASARAREAAVKDKTPSRLAYTIIGGFLSVSMAQLIAIMGWPDLINKIPGQGWLLIGQVTGYLANEAKQAASYYFGSSAGSQAKDATIKALSQ